MLRILGRLILVPLGLLLGTIAALWILVTLGLERATVAVHGRSADLSSLEDLAGLARGLHAMATVATIMPALGLVLVGEVARIRSSVYYIVGGGIALAALPLLARVGSLGDGLSQFGLIWQVFATAGFVGGFVYWLIAGRSA
jgi:hypothetical protein